MEDVNRFQTGLLLFFVSLPVIIGALALALAGVMWLLLKLVLPKSATAAAVAPKASSPERTSDAIATR